jgi:hypothetical protein
LAGQLNAERTWCARWDGRWAAADASQSKVVFHGQEQTGQANIGRLAI